MKNPTGTKNFSSKDGLGGDRRISEDEWFQDRIFNIVFVEHFALAVERLEAKRKRCPYFSKSVQC